MIACQAISKYLKGRKTPATVAEIARATKLPEASVRRTVNHHTCLGAGATLFLIRPRRKCRFKGVATKTYTAWSRAPSLVPRA